MTPGGRDRAEEMTVMMKFISNALLSIVMEKKAREKLFQNRENRKNRQPSDRERNMQELQENIGRVMTPERQELIRNAMAVQRAKAKILDDLNDVDKQKLYALAVKNLLREGKDDEDK